MQVPADNIDDYRWLVSEAAAPYLADAASHTGSAVSLAKSLRKELSAFRAHLVMEQAELRERAKTKFPRAPCMFFTRKLLEQSTEEIVARYKAARFPAAVPVADLCCGIGGDLIALAERGACAGVDRDPVAALLAEANCRMLGLADVKIATADACHYDLSPIAAWHIDPDRRPAGRRTSQPEFSDPKFQAIREMLQTNPSAAVKLAPAAEVPDDWRRRAEREWFGTRRECRQQVAWFGELAIHVGAHRATVIGSAGQLISMTGKPELEVSVAARVGSFVYEPHAAVLAAKLSGAMARKHDLEAVAPGIAYLTCQRHINDPLLSAFEVLQALPFDVKGVRAWLRQRHLRLVEVKCRGLDLVPDQILRKLRVAGENRITLLVVGGKSTNTVAILARHKQWPTRETSSTGDRCSARSGD